MTFKTFASRKISAASMLMAAATMALGGAIAIGAGAANQGMPGAAGKAVGVRIATVDLAQITHHLDSEVAMHQHFATELKSLQAKIKAKRKELRSLDEPLNPDSTISFKPGSEEYALSHWQSDAQGKSCFSRQRSATHDQNEHWKIL